MGIIQRQGIKNVVITYSGILLGFISLLIIQPRFLTKEELGLTRVLFSFSALIATFIPLGVQGIALRYFPHFRNLDKRHYGFFGFMVLFPLAGFILASLLILAFHELVLSQYRSQSMLFAHYFNHIFPFILVIGLINVLSSYCYAIYKTTVPSFLNDIVVRVSFILLILIYYFGYLTLDAFLVGYILIYVLQMFLLLLYILLYDRPGLKIDFGYLKSKEPKAMIWYGLLMSFAGLASMGLKFLDIVLLGKYVPLAMVGIYSIAAFIPTLIEAPYNALDKIISPQIANAWAHRNMNEIQDIYRKSTQYMLLAGGLLLLGINYNISALMTLLPKGYDAGIPVVFIISLGTFINMATGSNDAILFNSERYRYGTYLLVFLFLFAFMNNIILIPHYGILGAAMATALSAVAYNTIKFIIIYRLFNMQPFTRRSLRILLVILVTGLLAWLIPTIANPYIDMAVRSVVIFVIYAGLTFALNIVPEFHRYIFFWKLRTGDES